MPSIKATKIEFKPAFSFRKFKNLTIPLAPRITLLCGHNGVGKSTILGLLSSLSGLTQGSEKSYFGKLFDASIADIVYIDHAAEVAAPKALGRLSGDSPTGSIRTMPKNIVGSGTFASGPTVIPACEKA